MVDNRYNQQYKSDAEFCEWDCGYELRNTKYIASIKKLMDRNESFVRKHELTHTGVAVLYLVLMILIMVLAN